MFSKIWRLYTHVLRLVVFALVFFSGFSVLAMILVTCADVVLRRFSLPVKGAYDLVKIFGAITLACALPYTTAVKGHVAVEYFFHKLGRRSRVVVDSVMRLMAIVLFGFISVQSVMYGSQLFDKGRVTQTLQLPIFWVAYVIAFCSFVVLLVIMHNLFNPGREMIKP
jgi:TRAP-type C4-dicarboxylate transport system permease small subunit